MRAEVIVNKFAEKQLERVPIFIKKALLQWAFSISHIGLYETRKLKGYHDEPLKGNRKGQRSIRLNNAYRAIYEEDYNGDLLVISVIEVNKHDY